MLQFILPAVLGGGITALRGGNIRDIGLSAALGGIGGGITSGIGSLLGSGAGGATTGATIAPTGYFQGLPELTAYTPPPPGTITPEVLTMPDFGRSALPSVGREITLGVNTDITSGLNQPSELDKFLKSDIFKGMMAGLASTGGLLGRQQRSSLPPVSVGRLGQAITKLPPIF